jgi:hypothetical protein
VAKNATDQRQAPVLPNVKILLTSGYPGEALAHHCSVETEWPMISKPFRQSELAVRLQNIFGG